MKPPNKEYSASEVIQMLQSVSGAVMSGNLQNTVFGAPEDSSEYDALASNVHAMQQNYINKYAGSMLQAQKFKRVRAVAAATGMGNGGIELMDKIFSMSPSLGNAILGHHGADEALNSMLSNANGLAAARGMNMGSLTDPRQMNRNMMWAASQGALAFNNNFNKYGAVDANFTRGLSLQQSAAVSNNLLANRSQYEEWEKEQLARTAEWSKKNPNATNEQRLKEGILTEAEIKSFRRGTAMSDGAVKSFNEKIKSFQTEMNGFVSSITKITGDFDSAVDFLQDMTNGKAFSAGKEADAARKKAANMAANLRLMAAESGVDVKTMYNMMHDPTQGFGVTFDTARGRSEEDQMFGERRSTESLNHLAAGTFAEWSRANPNATKRQKEQAWESIQRRVEGFGRGDAVKHNVLLAEAVRTGEMTSEEAQKLAASGNQNAVAERLKGIYGNNLNAITRDKRMMEFLTTQNADMVDNLNQTSFNEGLTNEGAIRSQRNALTSAKKLMKTQLKKAIGKEAGTEVEKMQLDSMFEDDTLREAGLSEDQIEEAKTLMQSGRFKTADSARKYLVKKYGADEMTLNSKSFDALEQKLTEKYGDNEKVSRALKTFKAVNKKVNTKKEVTKDDVKQYRMNKRSREIGRNLMDLRSKYDEAIENGDVKAADEAREEIAAETIKAVRGEGETDFADTEFVRTSIENYVQQNLKGDENADKREKIIQQAMSRYETATRSGLSFDKRMKSVGSYLTETGEGKAGLGGTFEASSAEGREKLYKRYKRQGNAAALFSKILDRTNMTEEEKASAAAKFFTKFRTDFSEKKIDRFLNRKELQGKSDEDKEAALTAYITESLAKSSTRPDQLRVEDIRAVLDDSKLVQKTLDDQRRFNFGMVGADIGRLNEEINGQDMTKEEQKAIQRSQMSNDANVFAKNRAGLFTSKAVSSASARFLENNRNIVANTDRLQAIAMGKQFGIPGEFSREDYVRKLKLSDKMNSLENMFKGKNSVVNLVNEELSDAQKHFFTGRNDNKVTEKDIAASFRSILSETRNMSDDQATEHIIKSKLFANAPKLVDALTGAKDSKGNVISARRMLSAYVSGSSEQDETKRKTKLEDGYISQAISDGDKAMVNDEAVGYLKNMEGYLATIAGRTQ